MLLIRLVTEQCKLTVHIVTIMDYKLLKSKIVVFH